MESAGRHVLDYSNRVNGQLFAKLTLSRPFLGRPPTLNLTETPTNGLVAYTAAYIDRRTEGRGVHIRRSITPFAFIP